MTTTPTGEARATREAPPTLEGAEATREQWTMRATVAEPKKSLTLAEKILKEAFNRENDSGGGGPAKDPSDVSVQTVISHSAGSLAGGGGTGVKSCTVEQVKAAAKTKELWEGQQRKELAKQQLQEETEAKHRPSVAQSLVLHREVERQQMALAERLDQKKEEAKWEKEMAELQLLIRNGQPGTPASQEREAGGDGGGAAAVPLTVRELKERDRELEKREYQQRQIAHAALLEEVERRKEARQQREAPPPEEAIVLPNGRPAPQEGLNRPPSAGEG